MCIVSILLHVHLIYLFTYLLLIPPYSYIKQPWDGKATGDTKYKQIYQTLVRVEKSKEAIIKFINENDDSSSRFSSKSVKPGARGRVVTNRKKTVEKKLMSWLDTQWKKNKKVSRGIIFRRALIIEPDFCNGDFAKLKEWFYGGFKKRMKLSLRVISSAGQKLPKDWKQKHASIVGRVAGAQMPRQRPDGSYMPGVNDSRMANTDQLPFYVEDRGSRQWGRREDHERRMVSSAGQEKNRFTVQLTVCKSGRKVRICLSANVVFTSQSSTLKSSIGISHCS